MAVFSLEQLSEAYPKHLWIGLSEQCQTAAWEQVKNASNDVARWNSYVNYLAVNGIVDWLQNQADLDDGVLVWPSRLALTQIWEFVNGFAIELGGVRIVFVPSETAGIDEFCVPQEWVDIPNWAGDYYVPVQMNLEDDECWLRVWGFTSHAKLKRGSYDGINRVYSLEKGEVIESWNVFLVSREFAREEKAKVDVLPVVFEAEANDLIEQLGKVSVFSPRLEVEFCKWGALLENEGYREALYNRRVTGVLPALNRWFELDNLEVVGAIRKGGWQVYGEVFSAAEMKALVRRFRIKPDEKTVSWVKRIDECLGVSQRLVFVMNLMRDEEGNVWILPQLRPVGLLSSRNCLPTGIELRVENDAGEVFDEVKAGNSSNFIQLDDSFSDNLNAAFAVKIVWGEKVVSEQFVI